jgi:AbrB family looped-hinge helix DNA binding protein
MATIKMGKRGTIVLPAKLRKQFGLEDGSILNIDATAEGISIRPAVAYDVEIYTPERRAELLLNNAMTKEEWDEIAAEVRADGLDPHNIPFVALNHRDTLPTNEEWENKIRQAQMNAESHQLRA